MRVDQLSEPMFSPYFKLLLNINPELVIQRLISQRALSLQQGRGGVVWRDQITAAKETRVSVTPMYFTFALDVFR